MLGRRGEEPWGLGPACSLGARADGRSMACSHPMPLHLSSQLLFVFLPEVASLGRCKRQDEFRYENQLLVPLVFPHSFGPAVLSGEKTHLTAAVIHEHACVAVKMCS